MIPSPPSGSIANVNLINWHTKLPTTQSSQFANTSRERSPSRLKGFLVWRCSPFGTNGSSSFEARFQPVKRVILYVMAAAAILGRLCRGRRAIKNWKFLLEFFLPDEIGVALSIRHQIYKKF